MPKDISHSSQVKFHLPRESEALSALEKISKNITPKNKDNKEVLTSIKHDLHALFAKNTQHLIGELILNPEEDLTYLELGQRLKGFNKEAFNEFKGSISSIRRVAELLRKGEIEKLNEYTKKITAPNEYYQHLPNMTFLHFYNLHLPENLEGVRRIKNLTLRSCIMAELINKDNVRLEDLNLTKQELIAMGPHLTFLDCRMSEPEIFKTGNWTSNEITDFLSSCTRLKTLKISSSLLKEIPELPSLEVLDCSKSSNLEKISPLPHVKEIIFRKCHRLKEVGQLPNCTKLRGEENLRLKELPQSLPNCKKFELSDCGVLESLPRLESCEYFSCSNLPRLVSVPALPNCRIFSCTQCRNIRSLPELENCTEVNCSDCPITELPELAECGSLECSNCPIDELPALLRCVHITAENCPQLDNDPVLLRIQSLSDSEGGEEHEISIEELNNDPLKVLLDLRPPLMQGFLPHITYREKDDRISEGMDIGGLRNNLVSRIIDNLRTKAEDLGQLSFIKEDGLLPVMQRSARSSEEQRNGFQALGALFVQCLEHGYLTGNVFNPNLFRMIVSLPYEEVVNWPPNLSDLPKEVRMKLTLAATEGQEVFQKTVKLLAKEPLKLTDKEYVILKDTYLSYGEIEDEDRDLNLPSEENKLWVFAKMKEKFNESVRDTELPAAIIAREMVALAGSQQKWDEWCLEGPVELQNKIEGVLTKEIFKQAITWESTLPEAVQQKTKNYLNIWLEEASADDLRDLVFTITGLNSLAEGKELKFQVYDREPNQIPISRTCFSSIEIPATYLNEKVFKEKLELLIKQSTNKDHSGFDFK